MKLKITLTDLESNKKKSHEFTIADETIAKKASEVSTVVLGEELLILVQRLKNGVE